MQVFDEVPSSVSLLLQCGYRSKVCTNPRATKLDGTLHKLCEFHRRKANLNQQKLHKRHREERGMVQNTEPFESPSEKKSRRSSQLSVEPIHHTDSDFQLLTSPVQIPSVDDRGVSDLSLEEVAILEALLLDAQPEPSPAPKMPVIDRTVNEREPIAAFSGKTSSTSVSL